MPKATSSTAATVRWSNLYDRHSSKIWWLALLGTVIVVVAGKLFTLRHEQHLTFIAADLAETESKLIEEQSKVSDLQNELKQQSRSYFSLFKGQLAILANDVLDFGNSERITVFLHDGNAFIRVGRYARNSDFDRGRPVYPDTQGALGLAWRNDESDIENLPDPNTSLSDYLDALEKKGSIPRRVARNLPMKSRSFLALALEDPVHRHKIAVVVFESVKPNIINKEQCIELVRGAEKGRIYQFLIQMRSVSPALSFAREKGY